MMMDPIRLRSGGMALPSFELVLDMRLPLLGPDNTLSAEVFRVLTVTGANQDAIIAAVERALEGAQELANKVAAMAANNSGETTVAMTRITDA